MIRKTPKCSKGFPCGKSCISRNNNCWANLSTTNNKVAETFSQFVNRLVGIGTPTQSVINYDNSKINNITLEKKVETKILENKVLPAISAGSNVSSLLNNLGKEVTAGREATKLLEELKPTKAINVEVVEDDSITKIPKLIEESKGITIDIEAKLLAGDEVTRILNELKPEIRAGENVTKILEELKPRIEAGENVTKILEELKSKIEAGKEVSKILEELKPRIEAGGEVTKILEELKPVVKAGENVTKILEELKPGIIAGEDVTKILGELKPPIKAGDGVSKLLEELKPPIKAGKEAKKILEELKPKIEATKEVSKILSGEDTNTRTKIVKSFSELSKDDIKQIKANKKDIKAIYDILLSEDGKKEKEYLEREKNEIDKLSSEELRLKARVNARYTLNESALKTFGISGEPQWVDKNKRGFPIGLDDYKRIKERYGKGNLESYYNDMIVPVQELLNNNIELGRRYRELKESKAPIEKLKELENEFNSNNQKIRDILDSENDYEDSYGRSMSNHIMVEAGFAFNNYPRQKYTNGEFQKIYEVSINDISNKLQDIEWEKERIVKNGKLNGKNEDEINKDLDVADTTKYWNKINISLDTIKEMDSKYEQYLDELNNVAIDGLEDREKSLQEREENFRRELDKQFSGNSSEDKSNYNREGQISPNLEQRNLPVGDSSNPEEAKLQEIINERAPMMAIPLNNLKSMLDGDGEFKNVFDFENQKKGIAGKLTKQEFEAYKEARKKKEFEAFGVPKNAIPSQRPVYGFMGNFDDLAYQLSYDGIQAYGEIVVQFKPEVKDNITVTVDDSLGGVAPNQKGSPANKVSKESMPNRNKAKVNLDAKDHRDIIGDGSAGAYREPRYIEWQGGGRLSLSDVEKIHIPINVYYSLPAKVLKQLAEYGIEIVVLAPRTI